MCRNVAIHWFITNAKIVDSNAHEYCYTLKSKNAFKKAVEITKVRWISRSMAARFGEPMTDVEDFVFPPVPDGMVNLMLHSNCANQSDIANSRQAVSRQNRYGCIACLAWSSSVVRQLPGNQPGRSIRHRRQFRKSRTSRQLRQ